MKDTHELLTCPRCDGFRMPAEFAPHEGTILIWPSRPGSWPYGAEAAGRAFAEVARALLPHETVYLIVSEACRAAAERALPPDSGIRMLTIPTDDAWARDIGPTFLTDGKTVRGVNWRFNAWGGEVDGLYASYEADDAFAAAFCRAAGFPLYDASPFVLEGGSIHSDGEGTLLTSACCLLSPGRNPGLSREEIEETLCRYTGAEKVIWISDGIYNDETNGHIDNMAAFIAPGEVVLAFTDDKSDPQYELSVRALQELTAATDARGRSLTVHKLPIPAHPVLLSEDDVRGYVFEPGEDTREVGERLAASYVNFYFANGVLLLPQFGGENEPSDRRALALMRRLCPDRRVIPIAADAIIRGGGNIHCITQQIPGVERTEKK